MNVKKNGFYILKEDFFKKVEDKNIPIPKNGRPFFFVIEDKFNPDIFWVIPMTSQLEKAKKNISQTKNPEECLKYEINTTLKNSVFNIQDIFPITKNYIEKEFETNNHHFILKNKKLIASVQKKAKQVIQMRMKGTSLTNTPINIFKIRKILEDELLLEKQNSKEQTSKVERKEGSKNFLLEKIQAQREVEKKKHNL